MAVIVPFRGLLYNKKLIKDIEDVVAPPYDVISSKEQQQLYRKSDYNIIRLILNKERTSDTGKQNRYTRSRKLFDNLQKNNILTRDKKPAFYYYTQQYSLTGGEVLKRKGILALLKITDFEDGVVLRHERILSKPFEDRVKLIKECRANFSPIFMIYPDKKNTVNSLLDPFVKKSSHFRYADKDMVYHRLLKVNDEEVILNIKKAFSRKRLIIADGHHRYTASLEYRNYMRKMYPDSPADAPFEYVLVYLTSMEDEGLSVLPIHRVVHSLRSCNKDSVLKKISRYFSIEMLPYNQNQGRETFFKIKNDMQKNTFVLYFKSDDRLYLLKGMKDKIREAVSHLNVSPEMGNLDVVILHRIIFENILAISKTAQDKQTNITYIKGNADFADELKKNDYQMAFYMNPLSAVEIYEVVKKSEILPQKSTFFYPKLTSGFVINKIDDDAF